GGLNAWGDKGGEWTIQGDKIIVRAGDAKYESTFNLDNRVNPKGIDLTLPAGVAANNARLFQGIYALEEDRLKICFASRLVGRPGASAPNPGSVAFLLVFERVNP